MIPQDPEFTLKIRFRVQGKAMDSTPSGEGMNVLQVALRPHTKNKYEENINKNAQRDTKRGMGDRLKGDPWT